MNLIALRNIRSVKQNRIFSTLFFVALIHLLCVAIECIHDFGSIFGMSLYTKWKTDVLRNIVWHQINITLLRNESGFLWFLLCVYVMLDDIILFLYVVNTSTNSKPIKVVTSYPRIENIIHRNTLYR